MTLIIFTNIDDFASLFLQQSFESTSSQNCESFMNRLNSYYELIKKQLRRTCWESMFIWCLYFLCFAHSPLNISIITIIHVCVCGDTETELHLFLHCNVYFTARVIMMFLKFSPKADLLKILSI